MTFGHVETNANFVTFVENQTGVVGELELSSRQKRGVISLRPPDGMHMEIVVGTPQNGLRWKHKDGDLVSPPLERGKYRVHIVYGPKKCSGPQIVRVKGRLRVY